MLGSSQNAPGAWLFPCTGPGCQPSSHQRGEAARAERSLLDSPLSARLAGTLATVRGSRLRSVCVCVLRKCMCRGNRQISKPVDQPSTYPFRATSVTYFFGKSVTSFRRRALWHVCSSVDCHSLCSSAVMCLRAKSTTEDTQVVLCNFFVKFTFNFNFFLFLWHSCAFAWEPHWGAVKSDCIMDSAPWTSG